LILTACAWPSKGSSMGVWERGAQHNLTSGRTGVSSATEQQRLNSKEVADALGISVDAVRMRARRGTLEAEHDANGRLYVWLDADEPQSDTAALISAKDETIAALREQLEEANERDRENRRIIAALTSRIPAIEAGEASAARESPESAGEGLADTPGPQEAARSEAMPWWRRIFK
jgi:DNA-binding transcriptional MerR regulator